MNKKLLSLLLVFALATTLLAGCAAPATTTAAEATDVANGETTIAADAKAYKVAMILDTTIADGGWGAASYNAMVAAAEATGFETQYTDGIASADFATNLRSYCDLGFDLIITPGNQYSDAVNEVSVDYPDVHFAILNGKIETANVVSMLPNAEQIGYMAGALAGLMTKSNNIGFIGGMELDTTKMKLQSYEAAAKAVNPAVVVASAYAGSFSDSAKGKEIANSMISVNDVDVMFGDASAVDSGAREALAEHEGRYDIGQPADLVKIKPMPVLISSVVTDNASMMKIVMEDVKSGTYGNKTIFGDLANGTLSVGTFSDKVPADVQAKYLEIIEQIKAGTFIQ
ncbi:MAG: BMP family protein [Eubacteriales bacterium]|nr:BMP family protein [Eubacteriales bacterium]